jgi:hypothetical protein
MKLYAQHGYAKSDKMDRALEAEALDGVIFGPNNEKPESLRDCVRKFAQLKPSPDILIDPQLYVSLLPSPKEGNLPLYDEYYSSNLTTRDLTPRRIDEIVRKVLDFQRNLPVTRLVSPTIILESFTNRSAQIAQFLAQASMDYHAGLKSARPLMLSFVFNETALSSQDQVNEFLDTVSLYEAAGFYLVVARPVGQYQQIFEWERMACWMLILYSLGIRNRFEVVCGYTDFPGFLASAVGASAAATGWFNSLRQFDVKRFSPSTGGRPPKERYSSAPLLSSIFLQELDNCYDADMIEDVLTGTDYDQIFQEDRPSAYDWPPDVSTLHHWATLKMLFRLTKGGNIKDRIQIVEKAIASAEILYGKLGRKGVQFDPTTGPSNLREWGQALATFRALARL